MPSSTSSSDPVVLRAVPRGQWTASFVLAIALTLIVIAAWEIYVRGQGYRPCHNDTGDRWSLIRSQVGQEPDQTVIIGSSRIQFDFDLDTYTRHMGGPRPLQLAMPGTNPVGLLEHVAEEEHFDGRLILGATPALWFVPQGAPVDWANRAIGRYDNWSPSQRIGVVLAGWLQKHLAFINPDDLTLGMLMSRLELKDRPGTAGNIPPALPAYFAGMDEHRQARMWDRCDFGTPRAKRIQDTWLQLFQRPPPPPHLSAEEFGEMMKANAEQYLERIRVAIEKMQSRGVKVVFVRPPSTSTLREMERELAPREQTWDAMLQVTGATGIHFEDYAQLAAFDCPEWSHLTAADAVRYTEAMMPLLEEALQ